MIKKITIVGTVALCWGHLFAQLGADIPQDRQIAQNYFVQVKATDAPEFGDLIIRTARFFINTPYVGATLEVGDTEQLVVNLHELDCTTFMETCLALSRVVAAGTPDFEAYCRQLQQIRYRGGVIDGYTSRLHYTSDWIADNKAMGMVEDMTKAAGGRPLKMQLSFMSTHPDSYKHLKGHTDRIDFMRQVEARINDSGDYYYIPKEEIRKNEQAIRSGDIIGFTTSMQGMDISHIGIAYWQDDVLTFIHASSTAKKVIINPESLRDYCAGIKSNTGIIVLRGMPVLPDGQ
ncbi:MAG: DUF1460 domain-containing protein [Bacteroidetes bacterium]|nr:DUF1460 domain-containing protein [Bacteroidota bacterium]